jgi:catechol 2,3-dioxygenase-like lactoylglutathione lyase family enzyme
VRVAGLHQVTLAVTDLGRSLEFYRALFGAPVRARSEEAAVLGLGDGHPFLVLTSAGVDRPRIDRWGMAVEGLDPDRVVAALAPHGVTRAGGSGGSGSIVGPGQVRVMPGGAMAAIYVGDPNGLVAELHDPRDCGDGSLGVRCGYVAPEWPGAPLRLVALSHLTINVPDPGATNEFYRRVYGMDTQTYQAASPLLGVGPGEHFLMFIPSAAGGGPASGARIHHACLTVAEFDVERIQEALEQQGLRPRGDGAAGPLQHWVSLRMPNRGGAPDGTPEVYFSDPDGLAIQLQDARYCGGGGYLGDECD